MGTKEGGEKLVGRVWVGERLAVAWRTLYHSPRTRLVSFAAVFRLCLPQGRGRAMHRARVALSEGR
jgi:hypothetical protein